MSNGSDQGLHLGRLLGAALLSWWTLRLGFVEGASCPLNLVNLAFHEAGHLFLTPLGQTAHFLGGTLGQLAVPIVLTVYFVRHRREPLGGAFSTWWLGENFVDISVYMADARTLALPLVGGGEHDWNHLFFQFGLLSAPSVARVSGATHGLGTLIMILGLAWWLLFVPSDGWQRRLRQRWLERWPWMELLLPDP